MIKLWLSPKLAIFAVIVSASGAIVTWVERGKAPDSVTATAFLENGKIRRRPVFAYPVVARYSGKGDINAASSFHGALPAAAPDDRFDWLGAFATNLPPT